MMNADLHDTEQTRRIDSDIYLYLNCSPYMPLSHELLAYGSADTHSFYGACQTEPNYLIVGKPAAC